MVLLTYSSDSHVEEEYFSHIQGLVLFLICAHRPGPAPGRQETTNPCLLND